MLLQSDLAVFCVGLGGGASNELLHWWSLRENPNIPDYARNWFYWLVTLAMIGLGGGLSWLQLGGRADPLVAFQIGLAAPMFLQRLVKTAPERTGGQGAAQPSLRNFLKG